jgi:hypothetical protein
MVKNPSLKNDEKFMKYFNDLLFEFKCYDDIEELIYEDPTIWNGNPNYPESECFVCFALQEQNKGDFCNTHKK